MQTVELLGDDGLDRAVRAAWRRLDQVGLPSLARHQHPTNRPHLTLASADQWPPGAAAALGDALRALPVPVRLDRLVFFGGRAGGRGRAGPAGPGPAGPAAVLRRPDRGAGLGGRRRRGPAGPAGPGLVGPG